MSLRNSSQVIEHRATFTCSPTVMYSGNTIPPQWIRIFHANTSTSRRTQAAAIAYMFPHHIDKMNIRVYMRNLTARNRCTKMESYLALISPPPHFATLADAHTDLSRNKAVLVCDGGINCHIPTSPPPNKASVSFLIFVVTNNMHAYCSSIRRRQKSPNGKF